MSPFALSCLGIISILFSTITFIAVASLWLVSYRLITRESGSTVPSQKISLVSASERLPIWLCYLALPFTAWRLEQVSQEKRLQRLADPLRLYKAALTIQNWWRPINNRRRMREAEVAIAAHWRGYQARLEARRRRIAIIKIQSLGRRIVAMNEAAARWRDIIMVKMTDGREDKDIEAEINENSSRFVMRANRPCRLTGQTLAMTAALYDKPLTLEALLLITGADTLRERDAFGWTCLHYAVEAESLRCCDVIISTEKEAGVDPHESVLYARTYTKLRLTPIELAEKYQSQRGDPRSELIVPALRAYGEELARREGTCDGIDASIDISSTRQTSSESITERIDTKSE